MKKNFFKFMLGFIAGGLFFMSFQAVSVGRYDNLRVYTQVFNLVEEHFIEKIKIEKLVISSIRGLLGSLDPYSGYLSKKSYKKFKSESEGSFNGVGLELTLKNRKLMVVSVVEDSPAWNKGVLPKDHIVSVNGVKIYALDFTDATREISGKIGKRVNLKIRRPGVDKLISIKLRRSKLKINPVRVVLNENGILVVRITSFATDTAKNLKKVLLEEKYKKVILDLRNNPGGLLDQAIEVVDMFVEKGVIVKTVSRKKETEVNLAQKDNTVFLKGLLYILVDGASASASEIVASSLKDLKRAKVLGLKTYGKGSVQSVIPLPGKNQGGVKLTIARYFTALGKMIDKKGVEPDYKFLKKGVETLPLKNSKKDVLLQWALEKIK